MMCKVPLQFCVTHFALCVIVAILSSTWSTQAQETQDVNRKSSREQLCAAFQSNCRECILSNPACSWCFDNQTTPGTRQIRCRTFGENKKHCQTGFIENPKSSLSPSRNETFSEISDYKDIANQEVIQLVPQALVVKLRKGQPQKVNITFRKVVEYPLDLYYVMDLSHSMRDDLKVLQKLGSSLLDDIRNITNNVRLGFGTFVDKVMLPFASTVPEQLRNPCQNETDRCAPVFGFRHQLSVTSNGTAFRDAVSGTRISGNIDSPEGGFDALMQIAVCQDKIKWRPEALRVILFTSDASPHIAMDGKLAAILETNDMQCHLEKGFNKYLPHESVVYSKSKVMDYPSIGQLKKAFDDNKIQTIFAVTQDVLSLYEGLPEILENSFVSVLKSDSSNIVSVISKSYNTLRSKIQLTQPSVPNDVMLMKRVLCPNTTDWVEDSLECTNVSIGDEVVFQFELNLLDCPNDGRKSDVIKISSSSIRDVVNMTIDYICGCGCVSNREDNSSLCSSRGSLECGICTCNEGATGPQCQCTKSTSGLPLERNCTKGDYLPGKSVCSGQGLCECGKCQCIDDYFGEFCECRRSGCPEDSNGRPCGGKSQGSCLNCNNNPICECNKTPGGWTLDPYSKLCTCHDKSCKAPNSTMECGGHGHCACDRCSCTDDYDGTFCGRCIHPSCSSFVGNCDDVRIQQCVECMYEENRLHHGLAKCSTVCRDLVTKLLPSIPDCSVCAAGQQNDECDLCKTLTIDVTVHEPQICEIKLTNPHGTCMARYWIVWDVQKKNYLVVVRKHVKNRDCPAVNPLHIIIPVGGGILLIGIIALIIWKLISTTRDKHEYQKFVQETTKAKWASGESKLYVNPNDRVANPMFIGND